MLHRLSDRHKVFQFVLQLPAASVKVASADVIVSAPRRGHRHAADSVAAAVAVTQMARAGRNVDSFEKKYLA